MQQQTVKQECIDSLIVCMRWTAHVQWTDSRSTSTIIWNLFIPFVDFYDYNTNNCGNNNSVTITIWLYILVDRTRMDGEEEEEEEE